MIFVGFDEIEHQDIIKINHIDEIANTLANQLIWFEYDLDLVKYCYTNQVEYMVKISNIKEALICNHFLAKYLIVTKDIAVQIQKIATNYMFDSKILQIITSLDEIETVALNDIDGVIKG